MMLAKRLFLFLLMFSLVLGIVACEGVVEEDAAADYSALASGEPAVEDFEGESYRVEVDDAERVLEDCASSQGYWKNHADAWSLTELTIGGTIYSQDELLAILHSSPRGDVTILLAQQLIAAELNVENTAEEIDAIQLAQEWLATHAIGSDPEAEREEAIMLAETLDDYNNGLLAAEACDEADGDDGDDENGSDVAQPDANDDRVDLDTACTYSHGFWKNHVDAWDVTELAIGDTIFSQDELLTILNASPAGDATYILAHQWIAARLNVENDAETIAAIEQANLWLATYPPGSNPDGEARADGIVLAETLDAYNNGDGIAPACEDVDENEDEDEDAADDGDDGEENRCTGADPHPHAQDLANRYGVSYEEIMGWFCEGFGFGEIEIGYNLSVETGVSVEEIMEMRSSGLGWGNVRNELGTQPGLGRDKPNPGNGGNPHGDDGRDNPGHGGSPPGQNKDKDKENPGNGGSPPGQNKDKDNRGRGND